MNDVLFQSFALIALICILVAICGVFCIMATRNLIRILIGLEIITKSVTLLLAAGGWLSQRTALGQSLIITLIVIEVVVIAVAAGVVIGAQGQLGSLDSKSLRQLKG